MKKLLIAVLLLPIAAFAQGSHRMNQVLSRGSAVSVNVVPYAKVLVCTVNTNCASTASIYSDLNLSIPALNPATADSSGNYSYYVAAGCYDEQISSPGATPYTLHNVCLSSGGVVAPPTSQNFLGSNSGGVFIAAPYTPVNRAGDTVTGALNFPGGTISGQTNFAVTNPPHNTVGGNGDFYPSTTGNPLWNGQTPISTTAYGRPYDIAYGRWAAWSHNYWYPSHGPQGGVVNYPRLWVMTNNADAQLQEELVYTQTDPGDFAAPYKYLRIYGSSLNQADEGMHAQACNCGEADTTFAGTVSTVTSTTQLKTTPTVDGGNQGPKRPLLDLSQVVATGAISAHTAASGGTPESYTVSIATGSLPSSTAWGPLVSNCNTATAPLEGTQTNTVTCAVTNTSGTFSAGDGVTFGGSYHETAKVISAGTPSGGQQTITVALQYFHEAGSWVMANGCWDCYVVFTPNIGDGLKYPITVLGSVDSTHMSVAAYVTGSQSGIGTSYTGNLSVGVSGQDEFTIYRGAQVIDVQDAASNFAVDGAFTLMPNSGAFAVSDSVEESHLPSLELAMDKLAIVDHNVQTWRMGSTTGWYGRWTTITGAGAVSQGNLGFSGGIDYWGALNIVQNSETRTNYGAFGGHQSPPRGYIAAGLLDSGFEMQYAPSDSGGAVINAGCPMGSSGSGDCTQNINYWLIKIAANGGLNGFQYNPSTLTLTSTGILDFSDADYGVKVPTVTSSDNSTHAASTAFVKAQAYAPLASPTLTGTPTAPTATPGTNTTQLATTAFVTAAVGAVSAPTATVTTTATVTISGTTGYYFNQEATAATAVTYTLPAPTVNSQFCVKNSNNGSAADTGALEMLVANTGTQSIIYNGTKSTSGYIISSGAAGDFACVIGISATQWEATVNVGSWVLH